MMSRDNFSLKIPGRICLLGDKVDLLGKPVIAMTINLMMKLTYKKIGNDLIEFYSHNTKEQTIFNIGELPPKDIDLNYWSVLYERLIPKINHGFYLDVNSDIPIGCGLSTSAALSVGFLKVMDYAFSLDLKRSEIAELAYLGENNDLGIQCGRMDQYSISYGGVTFIETGEIPKVEHLTVSNLPIVVGDSREERKSSLVLNRVKSELKSGDSITHEAFRVIEECVFQGKKALLKGDFQKLGQLMDIQQEQEIIIKAATDKILRLCKASKEAGALGAKQMGAGGGGCMLAIAPGKQNEVAKAIEDTGGRAWIFDIFKY